MVLRHFSVTPKILQPGLDTQKRKEKSCSSDPELLFPELKILLSVAASGSQGTISLNQGKRQIGFCEKS